VIDPRLDELNERDWQKLVVNYARLGGWMYHHELPSQRAHGRWTTHAAGESGFPDLVLLHESGQIIFAELKTAKGKLTAAQKKWLDLLQMAGGEVHVWRPADRQVVEYRLTRWAEFADKS
jgi:hypothetical protein